MIVLAALFAAASALTTAGSTAVQHHAASTTEAAGVRRLLLSLVRRPAWLAALALGPIGFTFHALALDHGPIGVVQPIVIVGIVAALPLSTALARRRTAPRELAAAVLTVAALAVFLLATDPQESAGIAGPTSATLIAAVGACAAAVVVALGAAGAAAAGGRFRLQATLLGVGSGLLFGLMAVLMEVTAGWLDRPGAGVPELMLTWLPYALSAAGVGGLMVNQMAYRAAPLAASMPMLNVVNCLLTLTFGYLVLGERPTTTPAALVVSAIALAVIVRGLWVLSGSGRPRSRRTSSTSSPAAPSVPERAASGC